MKTLKPRGLILFLALATGLGVLFTNGQPCRSQNSLAEDWQRITQADQKIKASQITWDETIVQPPGKPRDIDKDMAQQADQERRQGISETQIPRDLKNMKAYYEMRLGGFTVHQRIYVEYDGVNVYSDLLGRGMTGPAVPTGPASDSHIIDTTQGNTYVSLTGVGEGTPKLGEVTRDPSQYLGNFAHNFAAPIFLVGMPITKSFTPQNTTITQGPGSTIILQTQFQDPLLNGKGTLPMIARMAVSTQFWRPLGMEITNPANHRLIGGYTLSGYRQYPGGVWFASKIESGHPKAGNSPVSGTNYDLVSARFNSDADLSLLHSGFAPGTKFNDFRFPDHPVTYKISGHELPSDSQVLALIHREEQAQAQLEAEHRKQVLRTTILVVVPIIIAAAIVFGLFRRRRAA